MSEPSQVPLSPMELRRRLNLSQVELAHRLGKHPSTVAKWESGSSIPTGTPEEIQNICNAYECSFPELVEAFRTLQQSKKGTA